MDKVKIEITKLPKNCFTCKNLDYDYCDCSDYCSHGSYFVCEKNENGSDKFYDDGKQTNYMNRYKRCWEPPEYIYFGRFGLVDVELKERGK